MSFSERLEVVEILRRVRTFKFIEGKQEDKCLEELKGGTMMSCCRRTSSTQRNILFKFHGSSQGKRWTVEILRREFVKSSQPSNLTEKQGGYECFQSFKLWRSRAVRPHLDTC
jgi:hypothetical protein